MTTQKQTIEDIPNYLRPMIVGPVEPETDKQWTARHKKFKSLDDDVQEILASDETAKVVAQVAAKYKFDETQIRNVARAVRLYYFSELPADEIASYLETNIPVQQKVAEAITATLMRKIIHNENILPRETTTVKDALEKYEDLCNQMVTNRDIIVYGTQSLARPTIGHWLTDYHLSVGQGEHSSIQRGNYLFHNKNSEQLSDIERQRLAIVLKSWDENIPLVVDPTKQEIIFPAQKSPTATKKVLQNKAQENMATDANANSAQKKSTQKSNSTQKLPQSVIDKVAAAQVAPASLTIQPVSASTHTARAHAVNPVTAQHVAQTQVQVPAPVQDSVKPHIKTAVQSQISRNSAGTGHVNRNINPRDLRNQHLTRAIARVATPTQPQATSQVRRVPTELPIVAPQNRQITQTKSPKPSGFVSFSSNQKLPTENRGE